ncbi:MAG TPA: hypothetical protein VK783_02150 [Bacteroidia bacterium]|nr:hypothetical protein [Bacteroidia bacterium]
MSNSPGNNYFLNNPAPGMNPFIACNRDDSRLYDLNMENEIVGIHASKDLLAYNYEDRSLNDIFSPEYNSGIDTWTGKSKGEFNVPVLRDPFNNLASKYKWALSGLKWAPAMEAVKQLPALWKSYAKEFIGITSVIPAKNKVVINYNRWFADAAYRAELAGKLLLMSTDKGLEEVAKWGPNTWGDSFDNLKYEGKAHEMDVLNRWKNYADDEVFRSFFKDKELIELSEKIFGHIAGTEVLFS